MALASSAVSSTDLITAAQYNNLRTDVTSHTHEGTDTALLRVGIYDHKTADETVNNSTTLQNDDHISIAVEANAFYALEAVFFLISGTTPDFKFLFVGPAGVAIDGLVHFVTTTFVAGFTEAAAVPILTTGANEVAFLTGLVDTAGTAGALTLQWAQNTANASDTKLLAGTWVRLTKVS